jgi:ubiquitin-like modifier-activating enzyme ATG7
MTTDGSTEEDMHLLQFQPFSSSIGVAFWEELSRRKLNIYKLNEDPVPILGSYAPSPDDRIPSRLSLRRESFAATGRSDAAEELAAVSSCESLCGSSGILRNCNTVETFRSTDKNATLESAAMQVWKDIKSGDAVTCPDLLTRFVMLSFADLKSHQFLYWACFPALVPAMPFRSLPVQSAAEALPEGAEVAVAQGLERMRIADGRLGRSKCTPFFVATDRGLGEVLSLADFEAVCGGAESVAEEAERQGAIFAFVDPCPLLDHPGWPLRNFLFLMQERWGLRKATVLCYRGRLPHLSLSDRTEEGLDSSFVDVGLQQSEEGEHGSMKWMRSIVLQVLLNASMPVDGDDLSAPPSGVSWTGWERNAKGLTGPRRADLSGSLDPRRLAQQSVKLNLSLMRWRQLPNLDLDGLAETKCLLLGAGTLGCGIARNLLSWGVSHITFVDSGRVSYSNPVRQSLYEFTDCLNGGRLKAEAAAEAMAKISPSVNAQGVVMSIPMPGHPVSSEAEREAAVSAADRLDQLFVEHDVVFLLMDSRESRWLPTLLATVHDKLLINAALGMDTFLVQRHGGGDCNDSSRLGCYFCNDVVAPENSLRDRALDQQCTVTRPALSPIACAIAVELMVGLLHHPLRQRAPADTASSSRSLGSASAPASASGSTLGLLPHQVRGFLSQLTMVTPSCAAFDCCTGCSAPVVEKYRQAGPTFVTQACNSPSYLEELTGLAALRKGVEDIDLDIVDDDDGEFELEDHSIHMEGQEGDETKAPDLLAAEAESEEGLQEEELG